MSKYDSIRFYNDDEVNTVLSELTNHPLLKALVEFTFPNKPLEEIQKIFQNIHSIYDFQRDVVYHTMQRILEETSEGITTSGFENLDDETPYLFISNHRDIILDTSLLNVMLLEYGKIMTASAVGDNLVQRSFHMKLARLNRNFIVKRNLSPRELLGSSKLMSEYMYYLQSEENRSVWIAQREGRTKDGWDMTHQGVLKMIAMASDEENLMDFFKKMKIVPVSISYEYDPTDKLKMPQLLAKLNDEEYVKDKNEDFINLMSGILGQKKRIHMHVGKVLDQELDCIKELETNSNKQIQLLAKELDKHIVGNYKLWPTNYIAYDLLNGSDQYVDFYSDQQKKLFLRRLELKVDTSNEQLYRSFLTMYANPVIHKMVVSNESV